MGKNSIRIGSVSPGLVKTEALGIAVQSPEVAEMIYETSPHIQSNDVTEAVLQMISAKPHVQIHDVCLRHVHEK